MIDDLKELKDCVTIHCLGSISEESYNFLIKKIERLEDKALNMHVVGSTFYCQDEDDNPLRRCIKQCITCFSKSI